LSSVFPSSFYCAKLILLKGRQALINPDRFAVRQAMYKKKKIAGKKHKKKQGKTINSLRY